MVSQEFKSTVLSNNLLRTRIMLKDSLVVDPTFLQFDEMLEYARKKLPNLLCPFEGDELESEISKWTEQQMNMELVELINNFSLERLNHLKKVIATTKADEIVRIKTLRRQSLNSSNLNSSPFSSTTKSCVSTETKVKSKKRALRRVVSGGNKIRELLVKAEEKDNRWTLNDVLDMEQAAKQIIEAAKEYKENK